MLSEKGYWIILIVGLIVFVSLIEFVLIPYEILDYNLGINLISESIGILFTIIFLTWLFSLRETRQWKIVKDEVIRRIGVKVYDICFDFINLLTLSVQTPPEATVEEYKRIFFTQLEEVYRKEQIKLNNLGKQTLPKQEFIRSLRDGHDYLDNLETKYSKFLDPSLTRSLMKIKFMLNALNRNLGMRKKPVFRSIPDDKLSDMMSILIHEIIKEIYVIHKMGIEIYYP